MIIRSQAVPALALTCRDRSVQRWPERRLRPSCPHHGRSTTPSHGNADKSCVRLVVREADQSPRASNAGCEDDPGDMIAAPRRPCPGDEPLERDDPRDRDAMQDAKY